MRFCTLLKRILPVVPVAVVLLVFTGVTKLPGNAVAYFTPLPRLSLKGEGARLSEDNKWTRAFRQHTENS